VTERIEKVVKQSVTDAIVEAMAAAEDMEHVLIISIGKGDLPTKFFTDGEQTIAETLWMVERFKLHMIMPHEEL
jgi:hypothetical protein